MLSPLHLYFSVSTISYLILDAISRHRALQENDHRAHNKSYRYSTKVIAIYTGTSECIRTQWSILDTQIFRHFSKHFPHKQNTNLHSTLFERMPVVPSRRLNTTRTTMRPPTVAKVCTWCTVPKLLELYDIQSLPGCSFVCRERAISSERS